MSTVVFDFHTEYINHIANINRKLLNPQAHGRNKTVRLCLRAGMYYHAYHAQLVKHYYTEIRSLMCVLNLFVAVIVRKW